MNPCEAVAHLQESTHKVPKSAWQVAPSRMKVTHHASHRTPTVLRAWYTRCLPGRCKSRRAPSRHCRDVRVYGHMITAMHKLSTPPPPPAKPGQELSQHSRFSIQYFVLGAYDGLRLVCPPILAGTVIVWWASTGLIMMKSKVHRGPIRQLQFDATKV